MPDTLIPSENAEPVGELYIARRASNARGKPLADLARSYLDRRREFEESGLHSDEEVGAHVAEQELLLEEIEECPAVTLEDIIGKHAVIREEMWDSTGGVPDHFDMHDRLTLTLADDIRRVLGATTAYRFDPSLWVESAIRAGMEPIAMIELAPSDDGLSYFNARRRLCQSAVDIDERYRPPMLSHAETAAVIDELCQRGLTDYYLRPAGTAPAAAA
jgi:hypothetical protein